MEGKERQLNAHGWQRGWQEVKKSDLRGVGHMFKFGILSASADLSGKQIDKLTEVFQDFNVLDVISFPVVPAVVGISRRVVGHDPVPEISFLDVIKKSDIVLLFPSDPEYSESRVWDAVAVLRDSLRKPFMIIYPDGTVDFDFSAFPEPEWLTAAKRGKEKKESFVYKFDY